MKRIAASVGARGGGVVVEYAAWGTIEKIGKTE